MAPRTLAVVLLFPGLLRAAPGSLRGAGGGGVDAEAEVRVEARPAWCEFVPAEFQSVACRGSSSQGCTCAGFCGNTTRGSWQWNPECCGCAGASSAVAAVGVGPLVTLQAVPVWCQFIPTPFQDVACRGSSTSRGCSCAGFCSGTAEESWKGNPECCGCAGAVGGGSGRAAVTPPPTSGTVPAWCQFVPTPFQNVSCRGSNSSGCSCAGFCSNTAPGSWQWNPECCGCAGAVRGGGRVADQPLPTSRKVPAWCQFVPTPFQSVACRGSSSSGCICASFCNETALDSWQWNPECCSCQAPQAGSTSSSFALRTATLVAERPAWCQFVPAPFQDVACRGSSSSGCTCAGFCNDTARESWQWNPECCGCAGTAGRGAEGAVAQPPRASTVPAWCRFVPRPFQDVACRGSKSGCSCAGFCNETAPDSWQWNPECCDCQAPRSSSNNSSKVAVLTAALAAHRATPAWCQYVPVPFQGVACRGSSSSGCACAGFCSNTTRASWKWNTECCAC